MDEKMKVETEEKIENDAVDIKDYYKEKEISEFFNNLININLKKILSILNNYIDCGDWKSCVLLTNNKIFRCINKTIITKFISLFRNRS